MRRNHLYTMSSALCLVACGGGGGSEGSIQVVPAPAPSTTPAPMPTATPTPTPAPTFTYGSFDLSQNRVFAGQVATVTTVERYTSDTAPFYSVESQQASLQTSPSTLELSYDASKFLVIRFAGETAVFNPAEVSFTNADGVKWQRTRTVTARGDAATFARFPNMEYVYIAEQQVDEDAREPNAAAASRDTMRYFLIGERTRDGDIPLSGTTNYAVDLNTTRVGRNRGGGFSVFGDVALAVDHANGSVTARLSAQQGSYTTGTTPETATLVFSGIISANGISGAITSPDSSYTGVFTGNLFGPRGIEAGMVFTLTRPDGVRAAGRLFGRRR